jgi:3-hydroxyisobutyrate dehydrogenase
MFQAHFGVARSKPDPEAYIQKDFAALLETLALMAGMRLESENVPVSDGLDPEPAAAR